MVCPSCQHENNANAKFCEECGTKLASSCKQCGHELSETAKFCPECGTSVTSVEPQREIADYTPKHLAEKILQSRATLEGERKQVTVLFVDIKSSMQLSAQIGAEKWHELLDDFFAILGDSIHRFEGTINQYTGDGAMALFGAPISHEDHAQRACYAALDLRDKLQEFQTNLLNEYNIEFHIRSGLNSGEVVVGKIGDDLRMDYTAQGHTVGVAQRIEQLAGADRIYISSYTEKLVHGFFQTSPLGESIISGVEMPLGIYDLISTSEIKTRLEAAREIGLTQFVGREDELLLLNAALNRAKAAHGQVVGVVGGPGLGKSRLCHEFVESCRANGVPVFDAHCPAHGKNIPMAPMLELVRNYFTISESDSADIARSKIEKALVEFNVSLEESPKATLYDFLGVSESASAIDFDKEGRQRQLLSIVSSIYSALSAQGLPSVVLIDDLHWVDPGSDRFVEHLVSVTEGSHALFLVNFRPEYDATWTNLSYYQQLPLVPLSAKEVGTMAQTLLGTHESVTALANRVIEWTQGNPFFTEEVIQSLAEMGDIEGARGDYRLVNDVTQLSAPPNVQALLNARIDRLPENAKRFLQTAAVFGKEFTVTRVARIDGLSDHDRDDAISMLRNNEFILERATFPQREYSFKHPLTHEVAYGSLLEKRRYETHDAVAQAIIAEDESKLDERAALLAYHFEQANQLDKAVDWHQRAAGWLGANDQEAAVRHWKRSRELLLRLPESPETIRGRAQACATLMMFGFRTGMPEAEVSGYFEEAKGIADASNNLALSSMSHAGYGVYQGVGLGNLERYFELGRESAQIASQTDDALLQYVCGLFHQYGALLSGRFDIAVDLGEKSLLYNSDDPYLGIQLIPQSPLITYHIGNGMAQISMGDFEGANTSLANSEHWANQLDSWLEGWAVIKMQLCRHAGAIGDFVGQLRHGEEGVAYAEEADTYYVRALTYYSYGQALFDAGQLARAKEILIAGRELSEQSGASWIVYAATLAQLALLEIKIGDAERAISLAQKAREFAVSRGQTNDMIPWLSLPHTQIVSGDGDRAQQSLIDAEKIIREKKANYHLPYFHELRALHAKQFDSPWDTEQELEIAASTRASHGMHAEFYRLDEL